MPPSLIKMSSLNVTIPAEDTVIASAAEATPIVPPSLIKMSSLKVTIPAEDICIASVALAEPKSPSSGTTTPPALSVSTPAPDNCILEAGASVPLILVLKSILDVPVPSPPPEDSVRSPPLILFPLVDVAPAVIVSPRPAVVLVVAATPISQADPLANVIPPSSISKISVPSTSKRILPASPPESAVAVEISK